MSGPHNPISPRKYLSDPEIEVNYAKTKQILPLAIHKQKVNDDENKSDPLDISLMSGCKKTIYRNSVNAPGSEVHITASSFKQISSAEKEQQKAFDGANNFEGKLSVTPSSITAYLPGCYLQKIVYTDIIYLHVFYSAPV